MLLAFAIIFADACLQIIIAQVFSEKLDTADIYRSVILGLIITPWAVYFLSVVVGDLDNARHRLALTVKKLENILKDDKAKTKLLEKEIVEHQKTQQRLREGTGLLRSFFDTSPDLIHFFSCWFLEASKYSFISSMISSFCFSNKSSTKSLYIIISFS